MEAATSSEMLVTKYQLAKFYIPEDFVMHLAPCPKLRVTTFDKLYSAVRTALLNTSYRYRRWIHCLQRLETKT
jgi:hypothetical protein